MFGSCIIHILYIYSTNIGTEYFKHGICSPFFSLQNAVCFIISNVFGSCIIHILYIYSTNIGTEYFKHGIYSPFFPLQNAVCFLILTYLVPVLFTFYIQCVLKLKQYFRRQTFNVRKCATFISRQLNNAEGWEIGEIHIGQKQKQVG